MGWSTHPASEKTHIAITTVAASSEECARDGRDPSGPAPPSLDSLVSSRALPTRTSSTTSMPGTAAPSSSALRTTVAASSPSREGSTSVTVSGLPSPHSCRGHASNTSR